MQHPCTWEAQFKSGIQTIAVMAVQEGVIQLGSTKRVLPSPTLMFLINFSKDLFLLRLPEVEHIYLCG